MLRMVSLIIGKTSLRSLVGIGSKRQVVIFEDITMDVISASSTILKLSSISGGGGFIS